tara:strand:+ start:138 stop:512 length:375 start_codon:yes stop_codon:yes gene_type:complete
MYKILLQIVVIFFVSISLAKANEISADTKIKLQETMNKFISDMSVDGKMIYIDTKSDKLNSLYFSTAHPMYIAHEGNYFLCTAGVDEEGEEHLVDFYVKNTDGKFKITDVSVDNRETTKKILGM